LGGREDLRPLKFKKGVKGTRAKADEKAKGQKGGKAVPKEGTDLFGGRKNFEKIRKFTNDSQGQDLSLGGVKINGGGNLEGDYSSWPGLGNGQRKTKDARLWPGGKT